MPKLNPSQPPKHCTDRQYSYVRINGQRCNTGKLSPAGKITPEAEKEYRRIIAEYLANQDKPTKPDSITVDELVLRFTKEHLPTVSTRENQIFHNENHLWDAAVYALAAAMISEGGMIQDGVMQIKRKKYEVKF